MPPSSMTSASMNWIVGNPRLAFSGSVKRCCACRLAMKSPHMAVSMMIKSGRSMPRTKDAHMVFMAASIVASSARRVVSSFCQNAQVPPVDAAVGAGRRVDRHRLVQAVDLLAAEARCRRSRSRRRAGSPWSPRRPRCARPSNRSSAPCRVLQHLETGDDTGHAACFKSNSAA